MNSDFEHYFTEKPTSELLVRNVEISLKNGHKYNLKSPSGVFAFGKVNRATKVFIENCEPGIMRSNRRVREGNILDLGCGYGSVGIVLKKENPFISLYMSDINERAVQFSKVNAKDHNIQAEIKNGNLFDPWEDILFDVILFNPPLAAGKETWKSAVKLAYIHLFEGGNLQIVSFHNKGGENIMKFMKEIFGNAKSLVKSGGVWVYLSEK